MLDRGELKQGLRGKGLSWSDALGGVIFVWKNERKEFLLSTVKTNKKSFVTEFKKFAYCGKESRGVGGVFEMRVLYC